MPQKNNKIIIYALVGIVFAAALYFVLTNFVFSKDSGTGEISVTQKNAKTPVKINVNLDKLDTSVFEDKRFGDLKPNDVKKADIKEIEVGKKNPFSATGKN